MANNVKVPEDSTLYDTYSSYMLMAWAVLEMIDEMKGTNMYKQEVKKQMNLLERAINNSEYYKRLDCMYNSDFEAVHNMTDHYKTLFHKLRKLSPSAWALLSEATGRLIDNPNLFAAMNNIQVGSSEDIEAMKKREEVISIINRLPIDKVENIGRYVEGIANIWLTNAEKV